MALKVLALLVGVAAALAIGTVLVVVYLFTTDDDEKQCGAGFSTQTTYGPPPPGFTTLDVTDPQASWYEAADLDRTGGGFNGLAYQVRLEGATVLRGPATATVLVSKDVLGVLPGRGPYVLQVYGGSARAVFSLADGVEIAAPCEEFVLEQLSRAGAATSLSPADALRAIARDPRGPAARTLAGPFGFEEPP